MKNEFNHDVYGTSEIVNVYRRASVNGLTFQENFCFDRVPDKESKAVLDIGIGGGRTVQPLSDMFGSYIGVDYSEPMIAAAKALYPDQDLRVMDGRNISLSEPVDCVVFSFNGISSVSYEDRLKILESMANALKPGGYLVYSAHSLKHDRVKVWMQSMWIREMIRPLERLKYISNRFRLYGKQSLSGDGAHAYVNDPALGFKLINVYVDIAREQDHLKTLGLTTIEQIGNKKSASGYDGADNWVYMVAQKES